MRIEHVDTVGSTQDVLKRRAEAGGPEAVLLARQQTGGHGRLGRRWVAPEGNLNLSVLLRPDTVRWPGHWSLLAGVALMQALAPAPVSLKWPNDVMLGGGKLAGVLVEAGFSPEPWLVIGFGVNLRAAPEGTGRAVACFGAAAPEAAALARAVLDALADWRARYEAEGFAPVRAAWLDGGPAPGTAVLSGGQSGGFEGLRDDGALLMRTPCGVVAVVAGEVG